jgi:hypothetical protein
MSFSFTDPGREDEEIFLQRHEDMITKGPSDRGIDAYTKVSAFLRSVPPMFYFLALMCILVVLLIAVPFVIISLVNIFCYDLYWRRLIHSVVVGLAACGGGGAFLLFVILS